MRVLHEVAEPKKGENMADSLKEAVLLVTDTLYIAEVGRSVEAFALFQGESHTKSKRRRVRL